MTARLGVTQGTRKGHPSAALKHRVGPGVSARLFHLKVTGLSRAQNNAFPLESCAESLTASHGSATLRIPTRRPAGSQAPVVAHTNVLESALKPKSYAG